MSLKPCYYTIFLSVYFEKGQVKAFGTPNCSITYSLSLSTLKEERMLCITALPDHDQNMLNDKFILFFFGEKRGKT